ncbi:MAG: hypothetical protein E4G77_04660 [Nitrosopumilus sp.]|nr:MAG: hypothetical protein E4G77_04660 [Nitrosopumilus sp.]
MNTLRGIMPIKTLLIDESKSASRTPDQTMVCANFNDGGDLSKHFLLACHICEGPLVPVSICKICKKAEMRRCTKCFFLRNTYSHEDCKSMVSFGSEFSKKYSRNITA